MKNIYQRRSVLFLSPPSVSIGNAHFFPKLQMQKRTFLTLLNLSTSVNKQ